MDVGYNLMINDSKTEVMLVGTRKQLSKVSVESIGVGHGVIASVKTVKNLDVYWDQNLKMDKPLQNYAVMHFTNCIN